MLPIEGKTVILLSQYYQQDLYDKRDTIKQTDGIYIHHNKPYY